MLAMKRVVNNHVNVKIVRCLQCLQICVGVCECFHISPGLTMLKITEELLCGCFVQVQI